MRKVKLIGQVLTVAMVGGVILLGAVTATARPPSGGCWCPAYYAPVTCSNGRTYPNLCEASCHRATGCVPTGDI